MCDNLKNKNNLIQEKSTEDPFKTAKKNMRSKLGFLVLKELRT